MDTEFLLLWPLAGYVYPEVEGFAVAIQYWVIKTRNYEKHCLGVKVTNRCRKCDKVDETNANSYMNLHISQDTANWQN